MNIMKVETSERRELSGVTYGKQLPYPAGCVLPRVFMPGKLVSWVLMVSLGLAGGCTMKMVDTA